MIYFAQSPEGGTIKIGSSVNVPSRLKQLEYHYGRPLALLATMKGGREEERAIHERFAEHRMGQTEQFRPVADILAFIGRPLLASPNPDAVGAMPDGRMAIIHLKGSPAYSEFVEAINRKTHIPKAAMFRLAFAAWCDQNGHGIPPEL